MTRQNGINVHRFLEGYGVKVRLYHESKTSRPANVVYGGRQIARLLKKFRIAQASSCAVSRLAIRRASMMSRSGRYGAFLAPISPRALKRLRLRRFPAGSRGREEVRSTARYWRRRPPDENGRRHQHHYYPRHSDRRQSRMTQSTAIDEFQAIILERLIEAFETDIALTIRVGPKVQRWIFKSLQVIEVNLLKGEIILRDGAALYASYEAAKHTGDDNIGFACADAKR